MEIRLLDISFEPKQWVYFSFLSFEYKDQHRSFIHIEKNYNLILIQFLWLKNDCWIIGI